MRGLPHFSDLPLHVSIAAAIARRGYESPTPVQAAVLDPAFAKRDLLVSSQTGSGKTLAFGVLVADALLTESPAAEASPAGDAAEALPPPPKARAHGRRPPRALVVAPTRELATQVARELEWLFEDTRLSVAAFTGGTSISPDLSRLRAGTEVVVGTPGRLVDLHKRKALDLSGLKVLVLDEADEMLDLGFKEDLEYLLGHAPPERRTLLFSATLPREIERLASTFQRDAARVNARPAGGDSGHSDIQYVAHLVRPADRLAAVVNVLLAAGDSKAIVFGRTRDGVAELHARLVEHGFAAVAMSGERAQGERDRALEALRSGKARVLVATNVAARGLDLPDVDLVVHADLPENADALTHRSGRTGRAGKKGTSMVIADLGERRKAERLLSSARAKVGWTPPPTAARVQAELEAKLLTTLLTEAAEAAPRPELEAMADRLRATLPERVLVSMLLGREVSRLPKALPLNPLEPGRPAYGARDEGPRLSTQARVGARQDDDRGRPFEQAVLFRVNMGLDSQAEPRWLLPLICRRGGITRREVGAIRVGPRSSTFEISAEAARDFALASATPDPRAPHVRFEAVPGGLEDAGSQPPPSRPSPSRPSPSRPSPLSLSGPPLKRPSRPTASASTSRSSSPAADVSPPPAATPAEPESPAVVDAPPPAETRAPAAAIAPAPLPATPAAPPSSPPARAERSRGAGDAPASRARPPVSVSMAPSRPLPRPPSSAPRPPSAATRPPSAGSRPASTRPPGPGPRPSSASRPPGPSSRPPSSGPRSPTFSPSRPDRPRTGPPRPYSPGGPPPRAAHGYARPGGAAPYKKKGGPPYVPQGESARPARPPADGPPKKPFFMAVAKGKGKHKGPPRSSGPSTGKPRRNDANH